MRKLSLPGGWTRSRLTLGAAAALALALALAPGELAPISLRAGAAACAIGAAAILAWGCPDNTAVARRLTIVSRQALSRDAGVALLQVDGRTVLVGYGGAVRLLEPRSPAAGAAETGAPGGEGTR